MNYAATPGQLVDDRPGDGVFRVDRHAFVDPAIFDLEMELIFERTWNFLGFAADVAKAHDYFTTWIGRVPVIVTRDGAGEVGAFLNKCPHKGAQVCLKEQGNARLFVCPYHSWTFDSSGKLIGIKEKSAGGYPASFDAMDHGLERVARVAVYRGLVFGSLSGEVGSLEDHLGSMKFFIDLAMDQGPEGLEPIPGRSVYTFRGNWKFQLDNGLDGYHLTTTHSSFLEVMVRRRRGEGNAAANSVDFARTMSQTQSGYTFDNGHGAIVTEFPPATGRPFIDMDEVRRRLPPERADAVMLSYNTLMFPNMQLIQNTAMAIRVIRPLAPDLTEMSYYCLGAIGEGAEFRAHRLRAFEDFYNASGLATPDDSLVYESCHRGMSAGEPWLQGYMRGLAGLERGPSELARSIGLDAAESTTGSLRSGVETQLHGPYRQWAAMIGAGRAELAR